MQVEHACSCLQIAVTVSRYVGFTLWPDCCEGGKGGTVLLVARIVLSEDIQLGAGQTEEPFGEFQL